MPLTPHQEQQAIVSEALAVMTDYAESLTHDAVTLHLDDGELDIVMNALKIANHLITNQQPTRVRSILD